MNEFPECEKLGSSRQRVICRGQAGLQLAVVNRYRSHWGLGSLTEDVLIPIEANIHNEIQHDSKTPGLNWEFHEHNRSTGPGAQLKQLLQSLGISAKDGCGCEFRARVMDRWGVEGCRRERDRIVGWVREASEKTGWLSSLRAGWSALASGLVFQMDWDDPLGWLVDESIRRAEERGQK